MTSDIYMKTSERKTKQETEIYQHLTTKKKLDHSTKLSFPRVCEIEICSAKEEKHLQEGKRKSYCSFRGIGSRAGSVAALHEKHLQEVATLRRGTSLHAGKTAEDVPKRIQS